MPHDLLPGAAVDAVAVAAVAALWSAKGQRHVAYMSLIGGLLRQWPQERVETFIEALAVATDDEEVSARVAIVAQTAARMRTDFPVVGWPRLAALIGPDTALSIRVALDCAVTVAAIATAKQLPADYLRGLGVADADGHIEIPYRDAGGKVVAVRKRYSLGSKPRWEKGAKASPYGEDRLSDGVAAGYLVLVEGESDAWTLWHLGIPALGIPGSECARVLQSGHVASIPRISVVQEGDGAGENFVNGVAARLAAIGWQGELRAVRMSAKLKDASGLYVADPNGFAERWRARMEKAEVIDLPAVDPISASLAPLPYKPFPVDALPAPLAEFVRQGAAALGCDASYFALPALAVAASLIGNTRTIRLKRDWIEPGILWGVIVGESGTLKTPALHLVMAPVYSLQHELKAAYDVQRKAFEMVKSEFEAKVKKTRKEDKPPDEAMPEPPTCARVVTTDTTVEGLARLLCDNPRGMLVCRDELRAWLASFVRYRGSAAASDMPAWLEFHRAVPVFIDRKSSDRPLLAIPRAAVCITGGIQPTVMARALTVEHFESGFLARLLLAMPPRQPKRWTSAEIAPAVRARYETLLRRLFALKLDVSEHNEPEPFVLRMTPEAERVWIDFYNEWGRKQDDAEGESAACLSKLEGYAARLAMLHHVVTRVDAGADDCDPVEHESVIAGATLARWFADEAERIYSVLRESDESRQARRLIDYIAAHGGTITARQLHKSNRPRYPSVDAAKVALLALAKAGNGTWGTMPPGEKGGRPTEGFTLHHQTPKPRNPETPAEQGEPIIADGAEALSLAPKLNPNPETPSENHGKNGDSGGFGVMGLRGQDKKQSDQDERKAPGSFGVNGNTETPNPTKPGDVDDDEEEDGELIL